MSLKLLKQSLDILDETPKENQATRSKANLSRDRKSGGKNKYTDFKDLTINRRFKQKRNIEDLRKEMLPDKKKSNINLKRLLALSQNTVTANDAEKILNRNNKGKTFKKPKKAKEPKSIFTEEDFLAFEREYFVT
ncbi:active regulator of SIRT1-like [Eurosta solidaginis]|uniref:active regulator of SIRT1-like n=1 Tax=Eurosta solidaginis TaxID=178769 RepID=UPI00353081FC